MLVPPPCAGPSRFGEEDKGPPTGLSASGFSGDL